MYNYRNTYRNDYQIDDEIIRLAQKIIKDANSLHTDYLDIEEQANKIIKYAKKELKQMEIKNTEKFKELLKQINENLYVITGVDGEYLFIEYITANRLPFTIFNCKNKEWVIHNVATLTKSEHERLEDLLIHAGIIKNPYAAVKLDNPFKPYTDKLAIELKKKNDDYGNSFERVADRLGHKAILIRLMDKYDRIENLILNQDKPQVDESLKDSLLDLAGYSILSLKYLKEHEDETN